MPFTTGTANTAVDLQVAINTHLTANGWTKVAGEVSQIAASPVSARYWRVNINEPDNLADFFEIELCHMYATVGGANIATVGANWILEHWLTGTGADLVSGTGTLRTADTNNSLGPKITYDFGSATIVREIMIKSDTGAEAPEQFHIEWSNDLITWTRMWSTDDQGSSSGWGNDEERKFAFDTAFLDPGHYDATHCRRTAYATTVKGRADNGMFIWQGPGYDAARRVYIGCLSNYDLSNSLERLLFFGLTDYDGVNTTPWDDPVFGGGGATPRLLLPLGPFNYWLYSNSIRLIVVVKNGLDDYLMAYAGFTKAFAQPEDWSHPLYIGATNDADSLLAVSNARHTTFWDPAGGAFRYWDGTWASAYNRSLSSQPELYAPDPTSYVWPYHSGSNGDGSFPFSKLGDNDSFTQHWMDNVVPTAQNELFLWPCLLCADPWGILGALDGTFAVPRGAILSAEQVITISAQAYRVFTNRNRSTGHSYVAIRED